jgi:uncharacterized protein YkwD
MKNLLVLWFIVILVGCGENAPVSKAASTNTTKLSTELQGLLQLVNEARATERICGDTKFAATTPLSINDKLTLAAQHHSEDMESASKLDHVTPVGANHYVAGTTFDKRIQQEGYTFKTAGENIAWNYPTAKAVLAAWLASPGHCKNIMKPAFTEIGLGKAGAYWTQDFAAPQ